MARNGNGQGPGSGESWEAEATREPAILSPAEQAERGTEAARRSGELNLAGKDPSLAAVGEPLRMPGELSPAGDVHQGAARSGHVGSHEEIIWQAVRASNAAWLAGRAQEAGRLFHPDVMVVPPDFTSRMVGREGMVASFAAFWERAKIHAFEEREHAVTVLPPQAGGAAVVTYRFAIRYEIEGVTHDDLGQEVLLLTPSAQGWQVTWRTQIPLPPPSAPR
jgi:hypothetical protein